MHPRHLEKECFWQFLGAAKAQTDLLQLGSRLQTTKGSLDMTGHIGGETAAQNALDTFFLAFNANINIPGSAPGRGQAIDANQVPDFGAVGASFVPFAKTTPTVERFVGEGFETIQLTTISQTSTAMYVATPQVGSVKFNLSDDGNP